MRDVGATSPEKLLYAGAAGAGDDGAADLTQQLHVACNDGQMAVSQDASAGAPAAVLFGAAESFGENGAATSTRDWGTSRRAGSGAAPPSQQGR